MCLISNNKEKVEQIFRFKKIAHLEELLNPENAYIFVIWEIEFLITHIRYNVWR